MAVRGRGRGGKAIDLSAREIDSAVGAVANRVYNLVCNLLVAKWLKYLLRTKSPKFESHLLLQGKEFSLSPSSWKTSPWLKRTSHGNGPLLSVIANWLLCSSLKRDDSHKA